MAEIVRDLRVDKRVVKQLSDSAIKKDPVRALVELITNSDDSYKRLAASGHPVTGNIIVEVVRKFRNSTFRVIDQAEGFDAKTMDERVGGFGSDTSGLTKGLEVRGFFGRGLKEAILGLGCGSVDSIVDGVLFQCSLDQEACYRRKEPVKISKTTKLEFSERFGINDNGTIITITVKKDGVIIPQVDNLIYQLERYYSLREINASDKRNVYLIEKDEKDKTKKSQILKYKEPVGEEVLYKDNLQIDGFPEAKLDMHIYKATVPLTQDGTCREGGILIKGRNSIHDITLFGFDGNPYAQKIFGELRCKYIDDLMKREEAILSDRRDGLEWTYPLCKAIKQKAEKELKVIIDEIKKEEENQKKVIENEKTRQRFQATIEKINKIALTELGEEGEGIIKSKEGKRPALPPNGFDFIPDFYDIIAGRKTTLTLRATVPWILKIGSIVTLECDNEEITIENKAFTIKEEDVVDSVVTFNPKIYGKRVGSDAVITASADGLKAEAILRIVAKIDTDKKHKSKTGALKEGLFNEIRYDPTLPKQIRHYFDKETKNIKISTKCPSVEAYLGPTGEGQDELHCQVLVAELVSDSVCREIARKKAETGRLQILGEHTEAINREHYRLIAEYAHIIHQALVASAGRRVNG